MRLPPFLLRILLVASPVLGGYLIVQWIPEPSEATPATTQAPRRTSIETIYEYVARTVIHEVTEPTTIAPTQPTAEHLADAKASLESIQQELNEVSLIVDDLENRTAATSKSGTNTDEITEPPVIRFGAIARASPRVETMKRIDEMQRQIDEASHVIRHLLDPVVPSETPASDNTSSDLIDSTDVIRQCTCDEAAVCRKESLDEMENCMATCDAHLQNFGENTDAYLKCFTKFNTSIFEAENCLFDNSEEMCSDVTRFIGKTDWNELTNFNFSSDAENNGKENWKRKQYNNLQEFLHCTKHCMHKKLGECTEMKGCGVKMPSREEFEIKMRDCTRVYYVTHAVTSTCNCLAWKHHVKKLQGACGIMMRPNFIDETHF